jgi:hypothetical protein
MVIHLDWEGYRVNRKRVQRLMRQMGLRAIYPRPKTSVANPGHKIYPYLLREQEVVRPNQVFAADITYIPLRRGHVYLVSVLDGYSRYVLSWRLSTTMETGFCVEALKAALEQAVREIFNTDQGSQFTATDFVKTVEGSGAKVSIYTPAQVKRTFQQGGFNVDYTCYALSMCRDRAGFDAYYVVEAKRATTMRCGTRWVIRSRRTITCAWSGPTGAGCMAAGRARDVGRSSAVPLNVGSATIRDFNQHRRSECEELQALAAFS